MTLDPSTQSDPDHLADPNPFAESGNSLLLATDLRTQCSHSFRQKIENSFAQDTPDALVIDFKDTGAISAACLGVLAEFAHRVEVRNVPPRIQRVFEVTGLNHLLKNAA